MPQLPALDNVYFPLKTLLFWRYISYWIILLNRYKCIKEIWYCCFTGVSKLLSHLNLNHCDTVSTIGSRHEVFMYYLWLFPLFQPVGVPWLSVLTSLPVLSVIACTAASDWFVHTLNKTIPDYMRHTRIFDIRDVSYICKSCWIAMKMSKSRMLLHMVIAISTNVLLLVDILRLCVNLLNLRVVLMNESYCFKTTTCVTVANDCPSYFYA